MEKAARSAFDKSLTEHDIGEYTDEDIQVIQNDEMVDPIYDDAGEGTTEEHTEPTDNANHANDAVTGPDMLVGAEIFLPHGDRNEIAKVVGRKRNNDGLYVGRAHNNPILDSRVFTVRFTDGDETDIAYNVIAEHLFSQVDEEGNQYQLFKEIVGASKEQAGDRESRPIPIGQR